MTKKVTRQVPFAATPPATVAAILRQLSQERSEERVNVFAIPYLVRLFNPPVRRTIFAMSGVAAVVLLFVLLPTKPGHSHTQPNDSNIIHQAFNTFDSVIDGRIKPEVTCEDAQTLLKFFDSRVNFRVNVPTIQRAKLLGGVSNYRSESLAHVVLQNGNETVYLYQTGLNSVIRPHSLTLAPEILEKLERGEWYVSNPKSDCSMVAWLRDSTLCLAIADMEKDRLVAYLK